MMADITCVNGRIVPGRTFKPGSEESEEDGDHDLAEKWSNFHGLRIHDLVEPPYD